MKVILQLLLASFFATCVVSPRTKADPKNFDVRDPKTGETFFRGVQNQYQKDQTTIRETIYLDLKNDIVYREETRWESHEASFLSYAFEDRVRGGSTSIIHQNGAILTSHKEDKESPAVKGRFAFRADLLSPSQVESWIRVHWADLIRKKKVPFELILPQRAESLAFELTLMTSKDARDAHLIRIQAQPRNFFLRLLAPPIEFHFSEDASPRLLLFRGPSPGSIRGEKNKILDIYYSSDGLGPTRERNIPSTNR